MWHVNDDKIKKTPEERFWGKVRFFAAVGSGCFEWQGAYDKDGYGLFGYAAHDLRRAHRYAWELEYGVPPPPEVHVMHSCDNRRCVNVSHLSLGTTQANTADKMAKGRYRCLHGDAHMGAKLTAEEVCKIRVSKESTAALAREYGVSYMTLRDARVGKTWKTVGGA